MSSCKNLTRFPVFLLLTFFSLHVHIGAFGVLPTFALSNEKVAESEEDSTSVRGLDSSEEVTESEEARTWQVSEPPESNEEVAEREESRIWEVSEPLEDNEEGAESEEAPAAKVNDPFERLNRAVFQVNDTLYFHLLKPTATFYAATVPYELRKKIRNAVYNFEFPARFANCVLQNKRDQAEIEMKRFVINSTLGVGGFFDVAQSRFGINTPHERDFGQTLAAYGIDQGPFLMLPVLGPSDARDFFGYAVDHTVMEPLFWAPTPLWIGPVIKAGQIVNSTSLKLGKYEEFKQAAVDPYASLRDAYMQRRENPFKQ